ncbi:uncharacterized protein FIBRA_02901 [Fibroporia radiculosa]|uniref:Uncharacterized protein n=1 Tax=Fibroporia radiculosa TaxID=599839 RepID=J4I9B2_9APHY|nr:uncharacterized protein FIBRA_02901 [Fibroporia radiculosa]CCM00856.1 predicted protein [Fibroporia radiculosa]
MKLSSVFLPLLAASSALAGATRTSLTRRAHRHDVVSSRQAHIQRDLLDVCVSLDVDLDILDIVFGHIKVCLCLSLLPDFIQVDVVAKAAVDLFGEDVVLAELEALTASSLTPRRAAATPPSAFVLPPAWSATASVEPSPTAAALLSPAAAASPLAAQAKLYAASPAAAAASAGNVSTLNPTPSPAADASSHRYSHPLLHTVKTAEPSPTSIRSSARTKRDVLDLGLVAAVKADVADIVKVAGLVGTGVHVGRDLDTDAVEAANAIVDGVAEVGEDALVGINVA